MNARFTLIVVLVFAALLALAYTQRAAPAKEWGEGAPTATPLALLELSADDIEEVDVAGADGEYSLAKVAGGWQVDGQPANDTVAGVVERLGKPTVVRDLPADREPEDYGFATPALTVTLKTADGTEHVLQIGDDTVADYNVYVRLKGDARIVLVSKSDIDTLKEWLTTPPLAPTVTPTAGTPGTPAASTLPTDETTPVSAAPTVPTVAPIPPTVVPIPPTVVPIPPTAAEAPKPAPTATR